MSTPASSGLYCRVPGASAPHPVPLRGVEVHATIAGTSARVELAQRFENVEARPIEAVYLFPLPVDAAVAGFAAEVDGRRIEGRVEERERAFEIYDDALADGHGAFLLDQERPNVFTVSVGNLRPGAVATLRLSWVQAVTWEGDALRFTLPTTVSPRYTPAATAPEIGQPDADKLAPERRPSVPYGLSLTIDYAGAVSRVESPTHPIRTTLSSHARVELSQRECALDRDVVVLIAPAAAATPHAIIERDAGGTRYAQLSFVPDLPVNEAGSEVVFLVDCSGSMGGDSIAEARRALELCIRALDARDRFDVVRFGSTFESLFGQARALDEATLAAASAFVRATDATLGGTEILAPLAAIFERPIMTGGGPRQVLLLTDGQVGNESEVIELARRHADRARVFAFGIGAGVSEHLVREVARATRGAVEMIAPGERIEPKVLRQFARVKSPALHDIAIAWGRAEVEQAPRVVPPVFAGEPLTVWARVGAVAPGRGEVVATLTAGGRRWSVPLELERAAVATNDGAVRPGPIAAMWGRAMIRELESDSGRHGSSQERPGQEARKRARLVELAKSVGLASSVTSWVAVEVRAEADKVHGAELRRVPIALTAGWGGVRPQSFGGTIPAGAPGGLLMAHASAVAARMPAVAPKRSGGMMKRLANAFRGGDQETARARSEGFALPPSPSVSHEADALYAMLLVQQADGSFPSDVALAHVKDRAAFDRLVAAHGMARTATAVVLAVLARDFGDRAAEWRAAADKARRWLGVEIDAAAVI